MNEPIYPISYSPFYEIYSFTSIGSYGSIQKIISFTEFQSDIFNLKPFQNPFKTKTTPNPSDLRSFLLPKTDIYCFVNFTILKPLSVSIFIK